MFSVRRNLCLRVKTAFLQPFIVVNMSFCVGPRPSFPSTSCKHLNSVATKQLLDSRFNILSAARHAASKVNAADLKFKIATLEFEELKSN